MAATCSLADVSFACQGLSVFAAQEQADSLRRPLPVLVLPNAPKAQPRGFITAGPPNDNMLQ